MTPEQARSILRKHAGHPEPDGEVEEGFLSALRPYQQLRPKHFQEVMEALRAIGPLLQGRKIDRELVADLWELVFLTWLWALSPSSKLRRQHLMTQEDEELLSSWLEEMGLTVSLFLGGEEVPNALSARKLMAAKAP